MATATESPRLGKVLFNHDDGNTPDLTAGRRVSQVEKAASHRDEYNENLPTSYRPRGSDKFMGKGKPPPARPPPKPEEPRPIPGVS